MPEIRKGYTKETHIRSDKVGNILRVMEEPVHGMRKFFLELVGEDHPRLIGEVDRRNKIMFIKRSWAKHYHFQMKAFGFNYHVLHDSQQFDRILMRIAFDEDMVYYMIPKKYILEHGRVKEFKKQGFEIQIFLEFEHFEQFKTKEKFERSKLVKMDEPTP